MAEIRRPGNLRWWRHSRARVVLAVVLCSAGMWGCSASGGDDGEDGQRSSVEPNATGTTPPVSLPEGSTGSWRSARVVDGDTLELSSPRGEVTVRVIGINAPESGECFGEEAADALDAMVAGEELVLIADRSDLDQFERSLRYVETVDGVDVGAELVAGGFAIARRYPPDEARADFYADLQRDAQRAQRGLWAPDACGASDLDGVEIDVEINADAPGDDSVNLNGEWVRFTNSGIDTVDLDGWEVADESASHRYRFSDLRLGAGEAVTLFSGCGRDDGSARYWCVSGSAVWNNSGDTVFLRDAQGNIVASLAYGDSS
ncbi:MAG TPA: lamin tail domain-containing protein [Ilumatobacteraceae bacterium]|nr:lamin tail domain-containing protein [Ilumatobacteraceae bacterium]